jgi:hypothetical protein
VSIPLTRIKEIIDASGVAPPIEALLPTGVRHRQLRVRTLLAGMLLCQADHRPAHLTRVRGALTALPPADQARPGVPENRPAGPHRLTYRQTERTFGLVADALAKDAPDGLPSQTLAVICGHLLEASIPGEHKHASTALAVDWTDVETFSRPPPRGTGNCADPEASWGHRSGGGPGQDSELFFGYYASAGTMMREEHGPPVAELTRRMTVSSCHTDPARALIPVLTRMPEAGIPLGDVLAGSGYAHRDADARAIPLRAAGAQLIQDLHPSDRGPRGTHHGAIIANGNLYCPATPRTLPGLGPLARDATPGQAAAHDQQSAELARHKPGKITAGDAAATTGSCAPQPWARSAARSARDRWPWTGSGPRSSPRPGTRRPAAPSRPSPSPRTWPPRPARSTTTHRRRTASPTPGAPAPNGPSPPPRTPPATTSPAAGPGSPA